MDDLRDAPPERAPLVPFDRYVPFLCGLAALIVYLPRLPPDLVLMGDSAVFVSAAKNLGVPQPSGYPLYVVLGHIFGGLVNAAHLGTVPWRLHLMSAVLHAATVALVARAAILVTGSRVAAIGGALTLAFARPFFLGSLYAEAFPLLDLATAVVWTLALEVHRATDEDRPRRLFHLALASGIASTHHQMIALTAPALIALVFTGDRRWLRDPALLARLLVAFVAPLVGGVVVLAYLAHRHSIPSWGEVRTPHDLFDVITRRDFGGMLSPHLGASLGAQIGDKAGAGPSAVDQVGTYLSTVIDGVGEPGALLAIAGVVYCVVVAPAQRTTALSLVLLWVAAGPVFAIANHLDVSTEHGVAFAERFSTMSLVPLGVLIAAGLAGVMHWLRHVLPKPIVALACAASCLVPLARHARAADLRDDRRGLAAAHDLIDVDGHDLPDDAIVLYSGDVWSGAATYVCGVERRCARKIVLSPGQMHLGWRVDQLRRLYPELVIPTPTGGFVTTRELAEANLERRPIFVTPQLLDLEPALRERFDLVPMRLVVQLVPLGAPPDVASIATTMEQASASALATGAGCEGCDVRRDDLRAPSLETAIPALYAIAFVNHARVLRAFGGNGETAGQLEARALAADAALARPLLGTQ